MNELAYLDANSGSMIAGALAAGFAGIAVVFKMWGQRVMGIFSRKQVEPPEPDGIATDPNAASDL